MEAKELLKEEEEARELEHYFHWLVRIGEDHWDPFFDAGGNRAFVMEKQVSRKDEDHESLACRSKAHKRKLRKRVANLESTTSRRCYDY